MLITPGRLDVQAVFYVMGLIGDITVGVRYRDQNGNLKTKTKDYPGPVFTPSSSGGWGDTGWAWGAPGPSYSSSPIIDDTTGILTAKDVRIPLRIDDIHNEAQWFFMTPVGYSAYKIRAISYEGINLGVRPDLQ